MRKGVLLCLALLLGGGANAETKRYIVSIPLDLTEAERVEAFERFGLSEVDSLEGIGAVVVEVETAGGFQTNGMVRPLSMAMAAGAIQGAEEDVWRDDWLDASRPAFQRLPDLPNMKQVWERLENPVDEIELDDPRMPALEEEEEIDLDRFSPDAEPTVTPESLWGIARVNAAAAWGSTKGRGVKVAVIDTGIDPNHPDLAPNIKGGYDATGGDDWSDGHSHGTHVAGTIGAVHDGAGVVGVAPEVDLYAVKVLGPTGGGRLSWIIKGLLWAANNDMDVANLSLGAPISSVFMRTASWWAKREGVVLVAAAGNSGGNVGFPAGYPSTIAVSASHFQDGIAGFSSRGRTVDFIAPGVGIWSTIPDGGFAAYRGTSMATPHVAGLAAIAVAMGHSGHDDVKAALTNAATSIGLAENLEGAGMIDAAAIR